jgi:hypothetical protein
MYRGTEVNDRNESGQQRIDIGSHFSSFFSSLSFSRKKEQKRENEVVSISINEEKRNSLRSLIVCSLFFFNLTFKSEHFFFFSDVNVVKY